MARQLINALENAGADVRLASEVRMYTRTPSAERLNTLKSAASTEAKRLIAAWRNEGWRPDVWFSYHPYYKAPDFIGPIIARHFGIALATAEASYAERRATGPWASWHAGNLECLRAAHCHFTMTARDKRGLQAMPGLTADLIDLPPFIDTADFASNTGANIVTGAVRLVTVAMMRNDVKYESYQFLCHSLTQLNHIEWTLDVVGDGNARPIIERNFDEFLPQRATWHGRLERAGIIEVLKHANLFVWPGIGEAYGLAFLEAQAMGLPVVALDNAGVPEVVRHGETGILTPIGSVGAYSQAIANYIGHHGLLKQHGKQARAFATQERDMTGASRRLFRGLQRAVLT